MFTAVVVASLALIAVPDASAQTCNGGSCNSGGRTVVYTNNNSTISCFSFSATVTYAPGGPAPCTVNSLPCAQCASTCAPTIQCNYSQGWGTCTVPVAGDTMVVTVTNCNTAGSCSTSTITCT